MGVSIDHDRNLRITGTRRAYARRRYDAANATAKLAVLQAFRAGFSKQRIAHLTDISIGTISAWVKEVDRFVSRNNDQ